MTSQHDNEPPMFADPRRETEEALFEMGAGYGDLRAEQGDPDEDWSPADLAAYVQRSDPEAAAWVIRALAARIDNHSSKVTDPRSILVDLSHALDSLSSAAGSIIRNACGDDLDDETRGYLDATEAHLTAAGRAIGTIADGWI